MKIDELFERLRPVGASREDFQSGSKYEALLSKIESKLDKAIQSSLDKDEDLYPIYEEQRQALESVSLSLKDLLSKKDSESVQALKKSMSEESKVTKITRKVLEERPDEDKLKFTDSFEASMAIKSHSEEIKQLMDEIKEYRKVTKQNKKQALDLSKVFQDLTNDLKDEGNLGAAATALAPLSKKFIESESIGKEKESASLAKDALEKSESIDLLPKEITTSLRDIYDLIDKKLEQSKASEENSYLQRMNLIQVEAEESPKSESDNILTNKLQELTEELDNREILQKVQVKSTTQNVGQIDSVERVNANSEEYLSQLQEDNSYKDDIALIREDVSKILSLMGERNDKSEDSEDDSENENSKSSGDGGFSIGSMFGVGKITGAITKLGPLLGKVGLAAGAVAAVGWAGYEAYDAYQESLKARENLDESTRKRNAERARELEELRKKDEDNIIEQIKKKNKEIYGTENPTEEMYVDYEKSQDNPLKRVFVSDEVYESRASRRKDEIIRQATNFARYGTETPNAAMIEDYDEMKYQTKKLGISKDEWYRVKDYITHPSEDSYNNLSDVEKEAVSNFKMTELKSERVIKDNDLLSQRDKIVDGLVEGGRENNEDTRRLAIEELQRSNYLTENQLKMLNSTPYGEKITKPVGINPRLEKNEWAISMKEAYRKAGITNEETLNALVAQDAHESAWGKSSQSREFNNYGNIHAGKSWKGKTSKGKDTHADGSGYETDFRVYDSMDDYAVDKVQFLKHLYDFNEDDSLEEILNKLQGGNKAGRSYAEAKNYKDAIANIYYGIANKTYFEDSNVLNEARLLEWSKKLPILNPKQYNGGFKDGVWVDNKNYSTFESGDMLSFKDNKVLPKMLGYQGNYNSDGTYKSISVNTETLEPVTFDINEEKFYDLNGNEIESSKIKVVDIDSPEYSEIMRRQLRKQEFLSENAGDESAWAVDALGKESDITVKTQKAFFNNAVAAAKNSKGITVTEAQLRARETNPSLGVISMGNGDFIQLPKTESNEGNFDLSRLNLGEDKANVLSSLELEYTPMVTRTQSLSEIGANVVRGDVLDDMRGGEYVERDGNLEYEYTHQGAPHSLDLRSDFTKSVSNSVSKATSKLSDWASHFRRKIAGETDPKLSVAIDKEKIREAEQGMETASMKKVQEVMSRKPDLPALKIPEKKESKEKKEIIKPASQHTSSVVTTIINYQTVDSLTRDDIGNIGTA